MSRFCLVVSRDAGDEVRMLEPDPVVVEEKNRIRRSKPVVTNDIEEGKEEADKRGIGGGYTGL